MWPPSARATSIRRSRTVATGMSSIVRISVPGTMAASDEKLRMTIIRRPSQTKWTGRRLSRSNSAAVTDFFWLKKLA